MALPERDGEVVINPLDGPVATSPGEQESQQQLHLDGDQLADLHGVLSDHDWQRCVHVTSCEMWLSPFSPTAIFYVLPGRPNEKFEVQHVSQMLGRLVGFADAKRLAAMGWGELVAERVHELHLRVTAAIIESERIRPTGTPESLAAYAKVSALEEAIAGITDGKSLEGWVARTGAIRAAMVAGDPSRAMELATRFLTEDVQADVRKELLEMQRVAEQKLRGPAAVAPEDE